MINFYVPGVVGTWSYSAKRPIGPALECRRRGRHVGFGKQQEKLPGQGVNQIARPPWQEGTYVGRQVVEGNKRLAGCEVTICVNTGNPRKRIPELTRRV